MKTILCLALIAVMIGACGEKPEPDRFSFALSDYKKEETVYGPDKLKFADVYVNKYDGIF